MLQKVFSAVAGVIADNQNGSKFCGSHGDAHTEKGLLGLVCRPESGSIDLVTQSASLNSNDPRAMYIGMNRIVHTMSKKTALLSIEGLASGNDNMVQDDSDEETRLSPSDHTVLGAQNG